jgi:hypothetical protein
MFNHRTIISFTFNYESINRLGDVMVSALASSAVEREFDPRSSQATKCKLVFNFVAFPITTRQKGV